MPIFLYSASDANGKVISGKIESTNDDTLREALRDKGLYPISIKRESVLKKDLEFGQKKIKLKELAIFSKQFSSLLGAGVTVVSCLDILKQQTENKTFAKILESLHEEVQKGTALSVAMTEHSKVFPSILIHMVEAGELSGNLDASFEKLAAHFDKESKTANKIRSALTYPIVVILFAIAAVIVIVTVVIPGFAPTFESLGVELPIFTKILLSLSDFFRDYWYILIIAVVLLVVGYTFYARTPGGKYNLSKLSLKLPYIGVLNLKVASSRFARTLSTMLASGLSLFTAIEIASKVVGNAFISKGLVKLMDEVGRGSTIAGPLKELNIFPPMLVHMVTVGESTGEIESLLQNTADYYDEEVDVAVSQLTAVMEPAIILVLGIIVLIIVLAVFGPILSLYSAVDSM